MVLKAQRSAGFGIQALSPRPGQGQPSQFPVVRTGGQGVGWGGSSLGALPEGPPTLLPLPLHGGGAGIRAAAAGFPQCLQRSRSGEGRQGRRTTGASLAEWGAAWTGGGTGGR